MARLFRFLLLLVSKRFYGDVRIRFRDGQVHGKIEVVQDYLVETLPEPDTHDPEYRKAAENAIGGVEWLARNSPDARHP